MCQALEKQARHSGKLMRAAPGAPFHDVGFDFVIAGEVHCIKTRDHLLDHPYAVQAFALFANEDAV